MAVTIQLATVIESDAKQIYSEYSTKRAYASLADGMHIVNRALLYALMHDFKTEKGGVSAGVVCSKVKNAYHLHSDESIHRTALIMSGERLPLLTGVDTSSGRFDIRDGIIAQRYSNYNRTKWGEYVHSSLRNAPMVKNYSLSSSMPDYYPTMFPYLLFTNYANINMGVTHHTLPMCPEEIFTMMLKLLENKDATVEDLLPYFKGPDIYETYTIIGNPQSRYALLKDGYGKFDILANMTFTRTHIMLHDVPYRSQKLILERALSRVKLESVILGAPQNAVSSDCVMSIPYQLVEGYTIEDARKELYDKTILKKTIAVELVGFHPKDIDTPYAGKLDIVGIRELLLRCINYGYAQRISDIKAEIDEVMKEIDFNSLMERLTRPEVLSWYTDVLKQTSGRKETLFQKGNEVITEKRYGKYIVIKGGITQSEVDYVFDRKGTPPNNNLDTRPQVLAELKRCEEKLDRLYPELEHDRIVEYLKTVIEGWLKEPECKRRSRILFTNGDSDIKTVAEISEQELVKHIVITKDDLALDVNIIFYRDCTVDYWNPKYGEDIPPDLMSKEIHTIIKCTTKDTLLIMNSSRRFKTRVKYLINNLTQYNHIYGSGEYFFMGAMVYEWNSKEPEEDDVILMVTSKNRVKKMPVASILQKFEMVKALPLYRDEYIKWLAVGKQEEFDKYTIEVLTERGVKRKKVADMRLKNVKGFVTLVAYNFGRDLIDFRLCKEDDNVMVMEDGTIREVTLDVPSTFKRDIYKEVIIEDEGKFNHYVTDREYYNLSGKITDVKGVFSVDDAHSIENVLTVLPSDYIAIHTQYSQLRIENSKGEH